MFSLFQITSLPQTLIPQIWIVTIASPLVSACYLPISSSCKKVLRDSPHHYRLKLFVCVCVNLKICVNIKLDINLLSSEPCLTLKPKQTYKSNTNKSVKPIKFTLPFSARCCSVDCSADSVVMALTAFWNCVCLQCYGPWWPIFYSSLRTATKPWLI